MLQALGIGEAFVLGTSQGGWIAARMAMLAPDVIRGIIPLGTSMDYESERSRDLGCWDGLEFCTPSIDALAEPVGDDWVVPTEFVDGVLESGLGTTVTPRREFWYAEHQRNYTGDEGRHRLRVASINLRDRDGLHGRLDSIHCPVLWLHGTADRVYSIPNAEEEITMFTNSAGAELRIVERGQHFLSASDPDTVNAAAIEFIDRCERSDGRRLRRGHADVPGGARDRAGHADPAGRRLPAGRGRGPGRVRGSGDGLAPRRRARQPGGVGYHRRPAARDRPPARNRSVADRAERLGHLMRLDAQHDEEPGIDDDEGAIADDRLRLIFTCCHPALDVPARVALTLRALGGLTTGEIARAFLVAEPAMGKRIVRAKRKIADAHIPYACRPATSCRSACAACCGPSI